MAGIACNGARQIFCENMVNKTAPSSWTLRLFKNNITPADSDAFDASGYTEADFTGYSSIALTAASWSATAAAPAVCSFAQQTFTSSDATPQTIYGYYITNAGGNLMGAERFSDGPYTAVNGGTAIKVTPTFSLAG